jgi:hypothetical protein
MTSDNLPSDEFKRKSVVGSAMLAQQRRFRQSFYCQYGHHDLSCSSRKKQGEYHLIFVYFSTSSLCFSNVFINILAQRGIIQFQPSEFASLSRMPKRGTKPWKGRSINPGMSQK